jgi:hypothetical protein
MVENAVLNMMIERGGAFNRNLAELYYVADAGNSIKLENAFSDIFEHFQKLSEEANTNEKTRV